MRIVLMVAVVLLLGAVIVLQQSTGVTVTDALGTVMRWPLEQRLAALLLAAIAVFLLIASFWQADKVARQERALDILQKRMHGLRDQTAAAEEDQGRTDAAVAHLVGSDPNAVIDEVQARLKEAEARTAEQSAQNEAVDLQSRIDEIRKRQQALRKQLGSVSEKRRVIEPMLGEVKERQALIERALGDLEKDETGKGLDVRLEETEGFLNRGHTRLDNLESVFGKFEQVRDRMRQLQDDLSPLRSQEAGIKPLVEQVAALQKEVDTTLLSLEKDDSGTIGDRLDRLSKDKNDLERRIAALSECFGSLESIRRDIGAQFERLNASLGTHLKR
ncbi:hypothetical protein [Pseudorhodoplanes sp.]|uniref:hypothetical protein n=1 Tax=Pseudorhodoplanes sp. TaxID=1934341 RepID=UPI00391B88A3